MNFQQLLTTGTALCFAAALAGCGGNAGTENASSGTNTGAMNSASTSDTGGGSASLTGAGSTFFNPMASKWAQGYNTAKNVKVDYQSVGSGAGIKQFTAQTVDFGASDAPLNAKEKAALSSPAVQMPAIAGAVVVAYNLPGAPKNLKMTGDVVAQIFMGKITKWNDPVLGALNPGAKLPSQNINVAHRSDGSGTTYIFTNFLAAASPEWKKNLGAGKSVDWPTGQGGKGNEGVAGIVKQSAGGLGYVELAYAKQNGLSYASIQNKAGQFIEPTVEATTAAVEGAASALQADVTVPISNSAGAKAYPIAGFTYLMVYETAKNAKKGAALKEFLKWAMTDGQKDAKALYYAPLPQVVVDQNLKALDALK